MKEVLAELSKYEVATPLLLTGTLIVARDIAHARFKEMIDAGKTCSPILERSPCFVCRTSQNT